jgi:hypothetical protein
MHGRIHAGKSYKGYEVRQGVRSPFVILKSLADRPYLAVVPGENTKQTTKIKEPEVPTFS